MKGDKTEKHEVQTRLRRELRNGLRKYKEKVEKQFLEGNLADAFRGMKDLTGQNKPKPKKFKWQRRNKSNFQRI